MAAKRETNRNDTLPKWAKDEIDRLERDLASAHEKLQEGPKNSTVFCNPYSAAPRPLGKNPSVRFTLKDGSWVDIHYDDNGRKGLQITTSGLGSTGMMKILPRASNSAVIETSRQV